MKLEFSQQDIQKVVLALFLGLLIFVVSLIFLIWIGMDTLVINQETMDLINENKHAEKIISYFLLSLCVIIAVLTYSCVMIIAEIYKLIFSQQKQDSVK